MKNLTWCFCGRMALRTEMDMIASQVETYSDIMCIVPFIYMGSEVEGEPLGEADLLAMHTKRINESTAVCVVIDEEADKIDEIGNLTAIEITHCIANDKPIYFNRVFPDLLYQLQKSGKVAGIEVVCIGQENSPNVKLFRVLYKKETHSEEN